MKLLIGLSMLIGLSGCDILGVACTTALAYGIRVTAVDSITGNEVAGEMTVIATDGAYADTTAQNRSPRVVGLVPERPGNYSVKVRVPGYQPWVRHQIRVTEDECHVRRVDLTALMQR